MKAGFEVESKIAERGQVTCINMICESSSIFVREPVIPTMYWIIYGSVPPMAVVALICFTLILVIVCSGVNMLIRSVTKY